MNNELLNINNPPIWTKKFFGILAINVLIFFALQMQMSTLPLYIKSISGSPFIVGTCVALGAVAALIIRPFAGYGIDRIDRRILFIIGMSIMLIAILLYQWFPYVVAVLGIRFIFGLGWGISTTSSSTMAVDIIPKKRFGEGMGYFTLAQSFPIAIAPAIGLAILKGSNFYNVTNLGALLIALALLICVFDRSKKTIKGAKVKLAFFDRSAIRPSIIIIFVGIGLNGLYGFASIYGDFKNYDNVGLFYTINAIALLVIRPLAGKLIDRFGFNIIVFPGFAGFILAVILPILTDSEIGFLTAGLLMGMSYGSLYTSLQTMAVINAPDHRRGMASATFFNGFDLGGLIGGVLAGALASVFGYSMMFMLLSIPLLIGATLYFLICRKVSIHNIKQKRNGR